MLLILDEIQSGLGRTGAWFPFQHEGILPDGVTVGKALWGGVLPVSAFVARREVMDVFTAGSHGSTFGGNALAAAVGLEALNVIEDEGLVERSRTLGAHMICRLKAIRSPALARYAALVCGQAQKSTRGSQAHAKPANACWKKGYCRLPHTRRSFASLRRSS